MTKKIILIIFISLTLSGCYDYKELNNIAITGAIEIDRIDDEFVVSAQVINPQAPDKTTLAKTPFVIYTEKGKTVQEAIRNITGSLSKYLYLTHLQVLIINESIAKDDVGKIIDYFLRNPSIRTEFYVLIGKNDNILNIISTIDNGISSQIKKNIDINNHYQGINTQVTFNEFIDMYLDKNKEIVLPTIKKIEKDENGDSIKNTEKSVPQNKIELDTLSIFKQNKLVGYLTKEESLTYNIVTNNIKDAVLTYPYKNNKNITIEIIKSKSKITTNNKKINIKIDIKANLNEINEDYNIENVESIKNIESFFEKNLNKTIKKNIDNIRNKYNSDIFNFLNHFYHYNYKDYLDIKEKWYQEIYKEIDINIDSNISLVSKGKIMEAINEKN